MGAQPDPSTSTVDRVVDSLRGDILGGRYEAGDRLPSERELSHRLGVHRGAVREGLRSLAHLGLIEVRPGGARVCPMGEANLGLVEHLLELDEIPDATLVSHVLEVHSYLFSACVRMAFERGSDAQLEQARELLRGIHSDLDSGGAYLERLQAFIDLLVDASGNFVLGLIRRALKPRMLDSLDREPELAMRLPREVMEPITQKLGDALAARDGERAQALVFELFHLHREQAAATLTKEQSATLRGRMTDHLTRVLHTPDPNAPDRNPS
jgi:DNA-binding FadR family transcriptional regulator